MTTRSTRSPRAETNRRGSPDVVEKRRAARHFNDVLLGPRGRAGRDGRTEKRRQRLLQELAEGKLRGGKRPLKPIDVLSRVQTLLELGETIASIRKVCSVPRPIEASPEVVDGLRRLHRAYGFAPEVYRFVGVDEETLERAGIRMGEKGRAGDVRERAPRPGPAKTRTADAPARPAARSSSRS